LNRVEFLTDVGMRHLGSMTRLIKLDLEGCALISDEGLLALEPCKVGGER
jgi:hypothetical protein